MSTNNINEYIICCPLKELHLLLPASSSPLFSHQDAQNIPINYCCGRSACHLHYPQSRVGNLCQNWLYRLKSSCIINLVGGRFWIQQLSLAVVVKVFYSLLFFLLLPLLSLTVLGCCQMMHLYPHAHSCSACFSISLLCVTVIFYFT